MDRERFLDLLLNSGFLSCCGYDGLSMAFDVPLSALQYLPEYQKHALMCLLRNLSEMDDKAPQDQMRNFKDLTGEQRLAALVQLSARFAS